MPDTAQGICLPESDDDKHPRRDSALRADVHDFHFPW